MGKEVIYGKTTVREWLMDFAEDSVKKGFQEALKFAQAQIAADSDYHRGRIGNELANALSAAADAEKDGDEILGSSEALKVYRKAAFRNMEQLGKSVEIKYLIDHANSIDFLRLFGKQKDDEWELATFEQFKENYRQFARSVRPKSVSEDLALQQKFTLNNAMLALVNTSSFKENKDWISDQERHDALIAIARARAYSLVASELGEDVTNDKIREERFQEAERRAEALLEDRAFRDIFDEATPMDVANFLGILWPFGSRVVRKPTSGCLNMVMNIIWFFVGGIWIALTHWFFGALLYITVIGIPFGKQHMKMAHIALTPFGREIIEA